MAKLHPPVRETVVWQGELFPMLEHAVYRRTDVSVSVDSVALVCPPNAEPARLGYRLELDSDFRTRSLIVSNILSGEQLVELEADGAGNWINGLTGSAITDLEGCIDVDLIISPFTNSLPIWRLGLQIGESQEMLAAWFKFPEICVVRTRQRYTRLDDGPHGQRYRFEGLESGFVTELDLDRFGVVLDYPGIWKRIWPQP